jgi:RND superfamily putative drug exporter
MGGENRDDMHERLHDRGALRGLARACLHHRWIVIGAWVALLVGVNAVAGAVGPDYRTDFTLPDSESKEVQELLEDADPNRAGFTAQIVARSVRGFDDPAVREHLESIFAFVEQQGDITVTSPYDNPDQVSANGTIAFAQLDIRDSRTFVELTELGKEVSDHGDALAPVDGLQVEYGSDLFAEFDLPESGTYASQCRRCAGGPTTSSPRASAPA